MTRDEEEVLLGIPREKAEGSACMDEEGFDHGLLVAYRGGTLPEIEVARVERHLIACAYCRDLLAALVQPVPKDTVEALVNVSPAVPRSRSTSRRAWIAGAIAAVAASAIFWLARVPSVRELPEYRIARVEGGARSVRSEMTETSTVFSREAWIKIKLAPLAPVEDASVPALGVFVAPKGGALSRASVDVRHGTNGELGIESKAEALLGKELGPKTIYLVIATDPSELSGLEGRPPSDLANRTGRSHILSYDVELRSESGER